MEANCIEIKKPPLSLDWHHLIDSSDDDDRPPEHVVKSNHEITENQAIESEFAMKSGCEIRENIARLRKTLKSQGEKLPDKGEKIKVNIRKHEDEIERRKKIQLEKVDKGREETGQLSGHSDYGSSHGKNKSLSKFAKLLYKKMDRDKDSRNVVEKEFEKDKFYINPCQGRKLTKSEVLDMGRSRTGLFYSQSPKTSLADSKKRIIFDDDDKDGDFTTSFLEPNSPKVLPLRNLRPRPVRSYNLVDEESPMQKFMAKLDPCMMDVKVYYPSRDDPDAVEVNYDDMKCLGPEAYISSTIMNFYLRCLQQPSSSSESATCNYHFFNTYFYNKLAKLSHGADSFIRFRKWWKGVNIFEKSYILLPIHEKKARNPRCLYGCCMVVVHGLCEHGTGKVARIIFMIPIILNMLLVMFVNCNMVITVSIIYGFRLSKVDTSHWSLVIICLPNKDDELGIVLLHLDSLGLHDSMTLFDNIKRFLKEEWCYLRESESPVNLPIPNEIWENLDSRVNHRTVMVPQQKNDYDCGLFVLFYMERFIKEAPERFKKKDLSMFSRRWFRPQEASNLRVKIYDLLVEQFKKAKELKVLDFGNKGVTKASMESMKNDFMKEVSLWQQLDHPNVTKMIGATMSMKTDSGHKTNKKSKTESNFCIVSEYVKGGSLRSYLIKNRDKKLPMKTVFRFALDIAKGLSYLHSKKIIHRDVKPENILIDNEYKIKLADFGESVFESIELLYMNGEIGTRGYMAPEVVSRKPYGHKCDVYSFGICLWEIYCCEMAYTYDLDNIPADIYKEMRPSIPVNCPRSLVRLMQQCWETNPRKRPEMKDVIIELEEIMKLEGWLSQDHDVVHSCFWFFSHAR
ncbi:hypothetical protein SSX86_015886 [Deinandra increscens subsp. villosa]|uniref:Protein kinase domain-containing protein n=1 Tax=Deinandra increscens subsp. villosa TaxID=3103831 RepID=A0AAP0CX18_9ASTR